MPPRLVDVRQEQGRWVVARPGGKILSSYSNRQYAIEAAKAFASSEHGVARWRDRDGTIQGSANYQLFTWLRRPWWIRLWGSRRHSESAQLEVSEAEHELEAGVPTRSR